jgi:membrane protein implicated in regulation of membrane protease activity
VFFRALALMFAAGVVKASYDCMMDGGIACGVGVGLLCVAALEMWFEASSDDDPAPPSTGREGLIGATAVVVEACAPYGMVKTRGERWRAMLVGSDRADVGDAVTIRAVDGLVLAVSRRASEHPPGQVPPGIVPPAPRRP